jgi:hypothetical protein
MWPTILNQTGENSMGKSGCVVHYLFWHIEKTVDSVHRPKDRNQALFRVNLLFDASKKLISRFHPDQIKEIIEEEP